MALPSNIPTSFVPPGTTVPRRFRTDLSGAFNFFALALFGIAFVLALGVFFYARILAADRAAKDATLAQAEQTIDLATVEGFVQLRNRLNSGEALLATHPAFSSFFTLLDTLTPATIRFSSLRLSTDDTGVAKLDGTGVARSFNALAAASNALAKNGNIKDAIFSNISVSPANGSVSFVLAASLDPKLITFMPPEYPTVPAASSTSTTSTPQTP